jgi:hypothetical protein
MQGHYSGGREPQHQAKARLLSEFHTWERELMVSALNEAIRLIESDKVEKLTGRHIRCIAEYDAITIDGECFFDKAFSSGKSVAACLACAMEIGWREALDDLVRFRVTVLGPGSGAITAALGSHEAGGVAIPSRTPS